MTRSRLATTATAFLRTLVLPGHRGVQVVVGAWDRLERRLGGPARRRVVVLLASVLALSSADGGTIGALAVRLESAFRIGNVQIGLLLTVSSLVGAVSSLPMGVLTDRSGRVRLLVVSICLWAAAMVVSGLAQSYMMLLLTRVALGIVLGATGPVVASLTGDLFPGRERSRILGFILTGELLGAGAGLLVAGDLGATLGWRLAFFVLAAPSLVLAAALHRLLPEPARGGQSRLVEGATEIWTSERAAGQTDGDSSVVAASQTGEDQGVAPDDLRGRIRRRHSIHPHHEMVIGTSPRQLSFAAAARYVLRVRSNRILIASSALGYFFLAGLKTFAVIFSRGHYRLSQAGVSILLVAVGGAAVAGTLLGGRLVDRLIGRGRLDARVVVAGTAFLAVSAALIPGLVTTSVFVALPLFMLSGVFLGVPNPALDAARLDVMPADLWGRAESVRTFVRTVCEAFAPLVFGLLSELFGTTGAGLGAGVNNSRQPLSPEGTHGLEVAFLIMLVPLALSGGLLIWHRRTYLGDVATADASDHAIARSNSAGGTSSG